MAKKHEFDPRRFVVEPGSSVNLAKLSTKAGKECSARSEADQALVADVSELQEAQNRLYASNAYSVLVILQGMDASGKDGIIRHVMNGVNPLGCRAYAFKAPDPSELSHHFLARPMPCLPARGMISLFNRSYYEEVLVVRVHPNFLVPQKIPGLNIQKPKHLQKLWKQRYREINTFERTLCAHGTLVLKFFMHLSRETQLKRLVERIDRPEKNWKFNPGDLEERKLWPEYKTAYEEMLSETSTDWAPWYAIPADNKWYARAAIADIVVARLKRLKLQYPKLTEQQRQLYAQLAEQTVDAK